MNLKKLLGRPKTFHRLTGLTPGQFTSLAQQVEPLFQEAERRRKARPNRQRKIGAGPKRKLSVPEALFGLLLYYRTYTNHVFLGLTLGIDDSNVGRYFRVLTPLIPKSLLPQRPQQLLTEEEVARLIVDATEQPTERRRGTGYSGKKKHQTVKTQIVVTPRGKIVHVSRTVPGNRHDKRLFDQTRLKLPPRTKLLGDLGYLGATGVSLPYKSSKLKPLTKQQKLHNQKHARWRIIAEHVLAQLKKFQILAQRFRNQLDTYNQIFTNIALLYNYRLA